MTGRIGSRMRKKKYGLKVYFSNTLRLHWPKVFVPLHFWGIPSNGMKRLGLNGKLNLIKKTFTVNGLVCGQTRASCSPGLRPPLKAYGAGPRRDIIGA